MTNKAVRHPLLRHLLAQRLDAARHVYHINMTRLPQYRITWMGNRNVLAAEARASFFWIQLEIGGLLP